MNREIRPQKRRSSSAEKSTEQVEAGSGSWTKNRRGPSQESRSPNKDVKVARKRNGSGEDRAVTASKGGTGSNPHAKSSDKTPAPAATAARFRGGADVDEEKYYGIHACRAVFQCRPEALIRAYVNQKMLKEVSGLLRFLATKRLAYHVVSDLDLEKICGSAHHEGICLLARQASRVSEADWLRELAKKNEVKGIPLLYLDGVANPHNVGAILRSMAHFGWPYLLAPAGKLAAFAGGVARVAEGGAEWVQGISLERPALTMAKLAKLGYAVVGTSSHRGLPLFSAPISPKTLFILGAEGAGMSGEMSKISQEFVSIPGTGNVESLNVSVAAGLLLGSYAARYVGGRA